MADILKIGIFLFLCLNFAKCRTYDEEEEEDLVKKFLEEIKKLINKGETSAVEHSFQQWGDQETLIQHNGDKDDEDEGDEEDEKDEGDEGGADDDKIVSIADGQEKLKKKFDPAEDIENNLNLGLLPGNKFYGDDPNVDPCGPERPRVLTDRRGTILSPGHEVNAYGNGQVCNWKFIASPGEVVELKVVMMDIEYNMECKYDHIEVLDVFNQAAVSLGKYCGRELPMESLMSSERILFLYLMTDDSNDVGKFAVEYRIVSPLLDEPSTPLCGRPAILPNTEQRIVNGEPARPFSWPWQVSIGIFKDGEWTHNCGGTILREDLIVTAAHCFYDPQAKAERPLSSMRIVAGEYDEKTTQDGPTQIMSIRAATIHEKYNRRYPSSPYDIAVAFLDGRLAYNAHVLPACLPREECRLTSLCYVTGWGDTDHTGDRTVLNQVRLPIVNHNTCKRADYYGLHMQNSMICAGYEEGGKDACQRDSGGPLVCYNTFNRRWYLHGIASWGIGCARPMKPGVYTRVTSYIDWIYDNSGVQQ